MSTGILAQLGIELIPRQVTEKYEFRLSQHYTSNPKHEHNLKFPTHPKFDNPLTGIYSQKEGLQRLEFRMRDGQTTMDSTTHEEVVGDQWRLHEFDPRSVRRVVLRGKYYNPTCFDIEIFGQTQKDLIVHTGNFQVRKLTEFELKDDERIVGVECYKSDKDGSIQNLQFVICRHLELE